MPAEPLPDPQTPAESLPTTGALGHPVRVDVRDLTWRPFGRKTPVLNGVSLRIEPGERILLVGQSGCGKSTLLRALAGVLSTTESGELSGSVRIGEALPLPADAPPPVHRTGPARPGVPARPNGSAGHASSAGLASSAGHASSATVGLLVQDPADAAVAGRVGRDVAFGLENHGVERDAIWPSVRRALASVGFRYGLGHAVHALSGGEAQRLALAGVLVLEPGLVLLDEPSSMLDPVAAAAVRAAVWAAVAHSGATIVLVEHDLGPWLPEIDRVIMLGPDGSVAESGAAAILLDRAGELAAGGVWAPGVAAPLPLDVAVGLCAPLGTPVLAGEVVVRAVAAGVVRVAGAGFAVGDGESPPRQTLFGVNAEVRSGEILAVVGPSGAGKSTLVALLAGLEPASTGTVSAEGAFRSGTPLVGGSGDPLGRRRRDRDLDARPACWPSAELARRVGWVPQQAELAVVGRSVRADVLSTSRALGVDHPEARVDGLLAVLGLTESADMDPHQLSGGQARRLALAGAIAHGPALLVLDEPTVGQDRLTWSAVAGVLVAARTAGVAVVVATHDPLLIALADRCLRLERGRVVSAAVPATPPGSAPTATPASVVSTTVSPSAGAGSRVRFHPLAERCGPLALLAAAVFLLVGGLGIRSLGQGLAGVTAELLLAPLVVGLGSLGLGRVASRGSRSRALRRLAPGLLAVLSVGFSTWLLSAGQNPVVAATAALRVAFFVLPGVVLTRFIDPFALGDHLAQRLKLPARPVVAAVAALQRFEGLSAQWEELRRARRVRGLAAGRGAVARARHLAALTFAVLVQSLRQAGRMAVAMEARGFSVTLAPGQRRTWAEPAPWRRADTALTLLAVCVALVPVAFSVALVPLP